MLAAYPINGETWLICGGRNFSDQRMFDSAMSDLLEMWGCPARVVHGNAPGADTMADTWGFRLAIEVIAVPAEWKKHGRAAGPTRNQFMLDKYKPRRVIGFPGGRGTADMIGRAKKISPDEMSVVEVRPT